MARSICKRCHHHGVACVWFAMCALLSCVLSARPCHASLPGVDDALQADLPVHVEALRLRYDQDGNVLYARGNVRITQGARVLCADRMAINLTTRDTAARGNVVLEENGNRIECSAFTINLDSQLGQVRAARVFIKEQNIHIDGQQVDRTGLDTYAVQQGRITTCDGDNPAWRIDAERVDVTVEGYARVRKWLFRIKGVPVAYIPYALFPVKTKRATGLLFPEIGFDMDEGAFSNNTFFWAISDNTDATLWVDAATRRGIGTGLEYRFLLGERTYGKVFAYGINETDSYIDHEYDEERDRDSFRGYASFEGAHYVNDDLYAKARLSYLTDREMYTDYREEISRTKDNVRKTSLRYLEKDESNVFVTKNWDFASLLLSSSFYRNLSRSGPDTVQQAPRIAFSSMRRPVTSSLPLFYQLDASYDYFWREEGDKAHRFDLFPRISVPLAHHGWLKLDMEFGVRALSYGDVDDGYPPPPGPNPWWRPRQRSRTACLGPGWGRLPWRDRRNYDHAYRTDGLFPSVRAELTADFVRVYESRWGLLRKVRHIVQPGLRYEYIPTNEQSDFAAFDEPDWFYRRHSVSYFIKNRIAGLVRGRTGAIEERDVGYVLVGQTFHLRDRSEGVYYQGEHDEDFSDLFAEMRIGLYRRCYFKTKLAYNPYGGELRSYNARFNFDSERGYRLLLSYRYQRYRFEVVDVMAEMRLTSFLYAFVDSQYDVGNSDDLDSEFGIDFRAQCWGSKLYLETSNGTGGRSSDVSIKYSFYLRGLGGRYQ